MVNKVDLVEMRHIGIMGDLMDMVGTGPIWSIGYSTVHMVEL